jgi:hypothetical protein
MIIAQASFLFGLLLGSSFQSNHELPHLNTSIPFRCIKALEEGEDAYRQCRAPSLEAEIGDYWAKKCSDNAFTYSECRKNAFTQALKWEISALKELKTQNEKEKQ